MHRCICILLISFLTTCSGEDFNPDSSNPMPDVDRVFVPADSQKQTIQLEPVLALNQLEENHISNMGDIYEDESGYIYWQDNRALKVHQYASDGNYVRSFGKEGKGPGELSVLRNSVVSGNLLLLSDDISQQVQIFDSATGEFLRTVKIRPTDHEGPRAWMFDIQAESDSTFIVEPTTTTYQETDSLRLFRYWMDGRFDEQGIFRYRRSGALEGSSGGGTFRTPAKFNAKSEVKMMPGGGWIQSYGRKSEFYLYNAAGKLEKIFELEIEMVELTSDHIQYEIDNSNDMIDLERSVRNADKVPDAWPLWNTFFISADGNLWIEINTNPPYNRKWWVVSQEGELLSKLSFPENTALRYIGKNHLITSSYPDGVMYVNRYRFHFQPIDD